jgi:hypothetical protein
MEVVAVWESESGAGDPDDGDEETLRRDTDAERAETTQRHWAAKVEQDLRDLRARVYSLDEAALGSAKVTGAERDYRDRAAAKLEADVRGLRLAFDARVVEGAQVRDQNQRRFAELEQRIRMYAERERIVLQMKGGG